MKVTKSKIELIQADIITLEVTAIINAAKESLLEGGFDDAAIHRGTGQEFLKNARH